MNHTKSRILARITKKLHHAKRKLLHAKLIDERELYKYWEQQHLKKVFERFQVDCVFDVGANYGQYARMIRESAGFKGLIISFEPIPEAAEYLRVLAKGDPNWIIVEEALSSVDGDQVLRVMIDSQFSSLSVPNHMETELFQDLNKVVKELSVKTERLATAFRRFSDTYRFNRPFLKLDTQGFDTVILAGSAEMLSAFIGIQSELSIQRIYDHSVDFRDAISAYQQYGFSLSAFVPNNGGHFPRLIETDCIMLRNDILL